MDGLYSYYTCNTRLFQGHATLDVPLTKEMIFQQWHWIQMREEPQRQPNGKHGWPENKEIGYWRHERRQFSRDAIVLAALVTPYFNDLFVLAFFNSAEAAAGPFPDNVGSGEKRDIGRRLPDKDADEAHTMFRVTAVTPAVSNCGKRSRTPLNRPLFSTGTKES